MVLPLIANQLKRQIPVIRIAVICKYALVNGCALPPQAQIVYFLQRLKIKKKKTKITKLQKNIK